MACFPKARWLTLTLPVLFLWVLPALAADPEPLELVQTIPLKGKKPGKLDHLELDAKGQRLFVANKPNNTLDIIDLKAGKMVKQIASQQGIQGIAYAPDLDRIFAALSTDGYCNVFDGKKYEMIKTIKFKDDADNVRYKASTNKVYVAHADTSLAVVNAKTYKVEKDIKLPSTPEGFELETKRPRLYINCPPNNLVVIDTEKNEIIGKPYVLKKGEGNHPVAIDEANHRLYIGCRKPAVVVVVDSETGKEISTVDIPGEIDDLFLDAKRKQLYAACGEGFIAVLQVVDADNVKPLAKIATAKDARTCYFDAEASRIYLAVPLQKDAPEVRVYKVK